MAPKSMDVFSLREFVVDEYKKFATSFTSIHAEDIRRVAPGRYLARGVLSLKGAKKELEVPFTWQESANGATMEGELNVERLQFGIGTGEWANGSTIGLGVRVKFNVRLRKEG